MGAYEFRCSLALDPCLTSAGTGPGPNSWFPGRRAKGCLLLASLYINCGAAASASAELEATG